ncbi:MAG: hypothetical protein ACT4O2_08290 [Beijerinckiaceae bacterium]
MYLSRGKAAKEAGVVKPGIPKGFSSGKLPYREKIPDGGKVDPAELFRAAPKAAKIDAEELSLIEPQFGQAGAEIPPYAAKFESQLAGLVAVLGGLSQIFESLTHAGDPDCCSLSRSGRPDPHRRRPLP